MARRLRILVLLTAILLAPGGARAQPTPIGPEFQVNAHTTDHQSTPAAVTVDGAGNFVVVWEHSGPIFNAPTFSDIRGRRFDATGNPLGGEFQVNTFTSGPSNDPMVAADAAGNFVVAWDGFGSDSPFGSGVLARRFDIGGIPIGGEFQVNTYTTYDQGQPAVAVALAGGFLVVWTSGVGSLTNIHGQRYDAGGLPLGGEFQVNTYTTGLQFDPAAVSDGAGKFVVVWSSDGSAATDSSGTSIQAQRFDAGGTPVSAQFQVNSYTTGNQYRPAVAVDGGGNFVVAWASEPTGGGIQAQRFDAGGSAVGAQLHVDSYTTGNQYRPAVAVDGGGSFVVVWESDGSVGPDTIGMSIQGQRYDPSGVPVGSQFQVNSYRNLDQRRPAVVAVGTDAFVALWDSEGGSLGSDESGFSVRGQLFAANGLLAGRRASVVPARLAKFVAKPAVGNRFTLPAADPLATGGALRFVDTGVTAGDDTYALPAGGWQARGNPPGSRGYRYSGAGTAGDPCRVILLTDRVIKATCRGPDVMLAPPFAGDVAIELSVGPTDRYCARLGGTVLKNDDSGARWRDAGLPAGCF